MKTGVNKENILMALAGDMPQKSLRHDDPTCLNSPVFAE